MLIYTINGWGFLLFAGFLAFVGTAIIYLVGNVIFSRKPKEQDDGALPDKRTTVNFGESCFFLILLVPLSIIVYGVVDALLAWFS